MGFKESQREGCEGLPMILKIWILWTSRGARFKGHPLGVKMTKAYIFFNFLAGDDDFC